MCYLLQVFQIMSNTYNSDNKIKTINILFETLQLKCTKQTNFYFSAL